MTGDFGKGRKKGKGRRPSRMNVQVNSVFLAPIQPRVCVFQELSGCFGGAQKLRVDRLAADAPALGVGKIYFGKVRAVIDGRAGKKIRLRGS